MWRRRFLDSQGYDVNDNIIYQDNKIAIQLAENGSRSIGKRSKHLNKSISSSPTSSTGSKSRKEVPY
jgi:hypothetical protein